MIFLLVIIFGYLDFRIQGDDIYNEGQSGFSALPKGMDFKAVYSFGTGLRSSFVDYLSKESNVYPPFVTIAYLPLTFLPVNIAYQVFSIFLLCFLFLLIYTLLNEKCYENSQYDITPSTKILLSLVATSLLLQTYPINFAIERGNYDIIAAAFAAFSLLAMTRGSLTSSVIFLTISTQLKVYPAILLILLFARFRWKAIIYFGILNFSLLFILGISGIIHFVSMFYKFSQGPFIWSGNHSLLSFLKTIYKTGIIGQLSDIKLLKTLYVIFIILPFAGIFSVLLFRYFDLTKRKVSTGWRPFNGIEIGIIGICFCLMSLIPSTGHDYKLGIHIIPLILLLSRSWDELFYSKKNAFIITAIISIATAYLFIPRFTPLPWRLLSLPSYMLSVTEMKTPALLLNLFAYGYLALFGNKVQ